MLTKHPGLTSVAVFALAIGIPVGLAPWHLVNVVEAPLPVFEGDRIQALRYRDLEASRTEPTSSYDFRQWREELTAFEALGAARRAAYNISSEDGIAAPIQGAEVTASTFDILRTPPLLGRTLTAEDETIGAPSVVVIGYDLWRSRLGGDPEALGQSIRIGGAAHTVVGVMPEGFRFPASDQLWLPLRERLASEPGQGLPLMIFGRLVAGTSPEEAQAELTAVGGRMALEFPEVYTRLKAEVVPITLMFLGLQKGGVRAMPEFYLVQVLALLLLAVACTNVGMLIFARTATRSAEMAVRTALGASRARIVSQVFTELLVLAVLAAGMGLLLLDWLPNLIPSSIAQQLPYWMDAGVTRGTVFLALSLAVFSAVVAGVAPALKVTGKAVQRNIQRAQAGRSGVRFGGVTSVLIIADVAIAVGVVGFSVGLTGVLRDAWEGRDTVGIEADQFLSFELRLPGGVPGAGAAVSDRSEFTERLGATQRELVRRLAAEPGVRAVTVATALPRMDHTTRPLLLADEAPSEGTGVHWVRFARVDVDFFTALDQPILSGRGFDVNDLGEDRSAVIVNTTFVDRVLGGRNPIGRRVRYRTGDGERSPSYEIVGVVGHLGMRVLVPDADQGIYHPAAPGEIHPVQFAVHLGDDPASFTPRVRALASEVDPLAVIADPVGLNQVFEGDWYLMVATMVGNAILVGVLLMLAASGIYAIMSFTVAERTREIGIRVALGAKSSNVALTVARRSLAQLGVGVLIGMPIAGKLSDMQNTQSTYSQFLAALIPGLIVLVLIGLIACTAPTLRALRITPTEALREGG